MFKLWLILLIGTIPLMSIASNLYNVHRCVLLPILHENKNEKVEKRVYKKIEEYLSDKSWCAYRKSNSVNSILKKYHNNMESHLANQEVLKSIADREQSGSLIKAKMAKSQKGTFVEVEIIGENGQDLLFKNRSYAEDLSFKKVSSAVEQITKLLDSYGKVLPYDGRIKWINNNEFSIDVNKKVIVNDEEELIIRRPIRKRINPLIPQAIEWEVERIGKARVVDQDDQQIFAKVEWFDIQDKIKVGDWVSIVKKSQLEKKRFKRAEIKSLYEYKKRASFKLMGVFGYGQTTNLFSTSRKQLGGITFGATTDFKWWMKNHHLGVGANIAYRAGLYSKKFGTLSENTVISQEQLFGYKMFINYRHFASQFFYGPHIIYSFGYVSYNYKMDYVAADGFTSCHFYGPAISVQGSFPISMNLRTFLRFEIVPFIGQFSESDVAYGNNPDSVNSSQMEFGVEKVMGVESAMYASGQWTSNKAKFDSPDQEIHFEDFAIKMGFTLFL